MQEKYYRNKLLPSNMATTEKKVGKRTASALHLPVELRLKQADILQRTAQELRPAKGVCRRGIFKFKTFEEADQWMEAMILKSTREYRP